MYEQMLLIRVFETESERQYKAAKIGGYCHLSSGQEAATVGVVHTMQEADQLVTVNHRLNAFGYLYLATQSSMVKDGDAVYAIDACERWFCLEEGSHLFGSSEHRGGEGGDGRTFVEQVIGYIRQTHVSRCLKRRLV